MRAGALLLIGSVAATAATACQFDRSGVGRPDDDSDDDALPLDASAPDGPLTDSRPTRPCPTSPDLIGCWRFEASDPTAVDDESLYNNDGLASGTAFEPGPAGGQALTLIASSNVAVPDSVSLDVTGPITIELWVRADTIPADPGRAGLIDHNGQWGLFLAPAGAVRCVMTSVTATALDVKPGTWTHIACVYDLQTIQLYQDGVAAANPPAAMNPIDTTNPDGIHIGENSPTGDDQLLGAVDEIRIWRVARSAAEIAADAQP
jgi:hypothetical protein